MANPYFSFKQFTIFHDKCAMKVTTDACLFGAWCALEIQQLKKDRSRLLDIGTGTGLLSLMIAQQNDLSIDALEIDEEAVEQANINTTSSPWDSRIHIIGKDIKEWPEKEYDIIVSNPPFYEREIKSGKQAKNIAHHSERLTLKQLFTLINEKLKPNGHFFLLLPYKRINEINKLVADHNLFTTKQIIIKQTENHLPIRIMLEGAKEPCAAPLQQELIITNSNNDYSEAFRSLLKDYYLNL